MSDEELNDIVIEDEASRWENLTPSNDFIFSKLMRNIEICKEVLEVLLDIKIDHIEYPEEEKSIKISADSKSVRLDVYVNDSENTVYNIEMQTVPQTYLAKRSRYYQGMIDLNLIEKVELYDRLKTSYVIFICTFDPFEENKSIYRFKNLCIDNPKLALNDGTYKYFFNTKGKDNVSKELRQLLNVFENIFPKNDEMPLVKKIREELGKIKANKEWRIEYMTLYLRDRENVQKGYNQGLEKGKRQTAFNMSKKGYTDEIIADLLEVDLNIVKEWLSEPIQ